MLNGILFKCEILHAFVRRQIAILMTGADSVGWQRQIEGSVLFGPSMSGKTS